MSTTKTATTTNDSAKVQGPKLQIASAIRPNQTKTPSTKPATADLLSQLTGGPKAKPAVKKSASRPTFDLTPEVSAILAEFAEANALAEFCETHNENVKAALKSEIWPLYISRMFAQKSQPTNPALKTSLPDGKPDCEAKYVVKATFKVGENTADELADTLVKAGVNPEKARALADNEMDFQPNVSIKFNELMHGHYEEGEFVQATEQEQAVANKAMQLLLSIPDAEPLSDEEKAILISRTPKIKVKDGFLQRVATYADNVEQLRTILTVVKPQEAASGAKFGISDSLTVRNERLLGAARRILGMKPEEKK